MSIFGIDTNVVSEQSKLDAKCLADAKDLGIVKQNGALHENFMIFDLDMVLPEPLHEAPIRTKIVRIKRTKNQQMNRLVKRQVLNIAAEKKDPNFQKWRKFTDLARKYRQMMNKKYLVRATMDVRKVISGARTAAMGKQAVDLHSDANSNKK
jgi:predicted nuclease of predicted toxin-antitoxin system